MTAALKTANKYYEWAKSHNLYCDIMIAAYCSEEETIAFTCQAESYKKVHEFSRKFRIKFEKEPGATKGCLDYCNNDNLYGIFIKLYAISELPPSCKVKYETIYIPAQEARTEKRAIVICKS